MEKHLSFVNPEQRTISLGKLKPAAAYSECVQESDGQVPLTKMLSLADSSGAPSSASTAPPAGP
ncbi:MAG: hypothetical protein CL927_05335 [Deltaproteobacteria bacterium]|nr:hypothetical protein [Deltaproteobacteria bacterium]